MKFCADCGDEIPAERVRATLSDLCVYCQQDLERQGFVPRYRMEFLGSRDVDSFENNAKMTKVAPYKAVGAQPALEEMSA